MKYLLFSDWHIKGDAGRPFSHDERIIASVQWLTQLMVERRPDVVVFLGDTFDSYVSLRIPAIAAAVRCVGEVTRTAEEVGSACYWLVGNHDQYSEDRSVRSVGWIPQEVATPQFPRVYKDQLGFVPYLNDPERFPADELRGCELAFAHVPAAGVVEFPDPAALPAGLFEGPQLVCFGHYHVPGPCWGGRGYRVGALCATSFADEMDQTPHGAVWIETRRRGGFKFELEHLPNPASYVFRTVTMGEDECVQLPPEALWGRLRLRLRVGAARVEHIRQELVGKPFASLEIVPLREAAPVQQRSEITPTMPLADVVSHYVAGHPGEGLDADRLIRVGRGLLGV